MTVAFRELHKSRSPIVALALFVLASVGCHRDASTNASVASPGVTPDQAAGTPPTAPFEVRHDSSDLTFFWFDEHAAPHAVNHVDEVPEASRERVRVDPPNPEQRAPGWVYIVDLRAPGLDGRYVVRALTSEVFASQLAVRNGLAEALAPPTPPPALQAPTSAGAHGQAQITLYGASWCGACHQAAAWMRSQNIPFTEHDIEREPAAAQEMYARARQQGVPTGSIPIIDVNGRLMVGFNANALQQAIRGG